MPDFSKLLKAIKDLIESADKHPVGSALALLGGGIVVAGLWVVRH